MENPNLHHFSLFLDGDVVIIPEERKALLAHHYDQVTPDDMNQVSDINPEEEIIELDYKGEFAKGVLVVYHGENLNPDHQALLFKILNAVNCSLKDIALASSEQVEAVPLEVIMAMNPNKIIIFGLLRHDLMINHKVSYEIFNEDGVEFLFADDLKIISENTNLKRSLWDQLQILFSIKK